MDIREGYISPFNVVVDAFAWEILHSQRFSRSDFTGKLPTCRHFGKVLASILLFGFTSKLIPFRGEDRRDPACSQQNISNFSWGFSV